MENKHEIIVIVIIIKAMLMMINPCEWLYMMIINNTRWYLFFSSILVVENRYMCPKKKIFLKKLQAFFSIFILLCVCMVYKRKKKNSFDHNHCHHHHQLKKLTIQNGSCFLFFFVFRNPAVLYIYIWIQNTFFSSEKKRRSNVFINILNFTHLFHSMCHDVCSKLLLLLLFSCDQNNNSWTIYTTQHNTRIK